MKKTDNIIIRVDEDLKNRFQKLTKENDLTVSAVLNACIADMLCRNKIPMNIKHGGHMPPKRRRALANVHRHVPHRAADDAHELRLGVRPGLPVEPAHDALHRAALVVLHELGVDARRRIARAVVRLAEIPARICEHVWLDDLHARNIRRLDFHGSPFLSVTSGRAARRQG